MLATALRAAGVEVGTGQLVACRRAVLALDGQDPADRYLAARTTMVSDPADLAVFERVFKQLAAASLGSFAAGDDAEHQAEAMPTSARASVSDRADPARDDAEEEALTAGLRASDRERLRHRRFDRATPEERAALDALIDRIPSVTPRRRSRRTRPGHRGELDVPRTLERAIATDGELFDRAHRHRVDRPRRLVLLLDVSGSMAAHARALLRFAVGLRRAADRHARQHVEVFAFATRLTRLSDALADRDPDAALTAAAAEVTDWDGGTRIGASIDELVRVWGRRGVLRGAVVVVCSDGLERGDPDLLGAAVGRLRRHAHRVVWVNPLAGDPRFEPTQRGMRAALPHLDVFLPGHDLAAIEDLAEVLRAVR